MTNRIGTTHTRDNEDEQPRSEKLGKRPCSADLRKWGLIDYIGRSRQTERRIDRLIANGYLSTDCGGIELYDALARNESAVEVMGNDHLRVIAHELLNSLRSNASVDWQHRESARARMRILVKRILPKHGYPPDLQDAAVQTVLQQAEVLSERWAA